MAIKKKDPVAKPVLVRDWLRQAPPHEELTVIGDIKCLINRTVEEKLDRLTMQTWSTLDYKSKFFNNQDGELCISASLLLQVSYGKYIDKETAGEEITTRTLVGAITYPLSYFPDNVHFDNTAKTLCLTNAASELGVQFGRGLNDEVEPVVINQKKTAPKKREAVKIKPDMAILKEYQEALLAGDTAKIEMLTSMYALKIEE